MDTMSSKEMTTRRNWVIILGICMMFLGLLTISLAGLTTLISIFLIGVILTIRGGIDVISSFIHHKESGFWLQLFGGTLALVVGILILSRPGATAAVITYTIGLFFLAMGLYKTVSAPIRHEANWGWLLFSGLISLVLGVWIIGAWPEISLFLIGLFVGVEILVQGAIMTFSPGYMIAETRRGGREAYAH